MTIDSHGDGHRRFKAATIRAASKAARILDRLHYAHLPWAREGRRHHDRGPAPVNGRRIGMPVAAGRAFVAERFLRPAQAFVATEAASGAVLLAATVAALAWANSPWEGSYRNLWEAKLSLDASLFDISEDLRHAINEGLMAIFFFVAGLEIKRELLHGELASARRAALPVAAAIGGMAVPALIYTALNAGRAGGHGWGIPMATDIAFALGAFALLGRRVPFALKVFILALAIVDDLGAIVAIAVFYAGSISLDALAVAAVAILALVAAGRAGIRTVNVYVLIGALLWVAVLKSGVHATLAGVVLAALTPARPYYDRDRFGESVAGLVETFEHARRTGDSEAEQSAIGQIEGLARDSEAPLDRLERVLHPWVSYLIVPLFALANAGVEISGHAVRTAAESPVALGVLAGLVLGKPLGIFAFAWLALRLRLASLPGNVSLVHILGAGLLGGIGFTVSLFISGLAFESAELVVEAKLGILAASTLAAVAGFIYLWIAPGEPEPVVEQQGSFD
jgi:NhaA family Na+:H+ antiporter